MTTKTGLTHAELKTKQRAIREGFPQTMGLRAHRAISWIGRAETCGADDDAKFIFYGSRSTPLVRGDFPRIDRSQPHQVASELSHRVADWTW